MDGYRSFKYVSSLRETHGSIWPTTLLKKNNLNFTRYRFDFFSFGFLIFVSEYVRVRVRVRVCVRVCVCMWVCMCVCVHRITFNSHSSIFSSKAFSNSSCSHTVVASFPTFLPMFWNDFPIFRCPWSTYYWHVINMVLVYRLSRFPISVFRCCNYFNTVYVCVNVCVCVCMCVCVCVCVCLCVQHHLRLGFPFLVVVITAASKPENLLTKKLCMVRGISFYSSVLAPIVMVSKFREHGKGDTKYKVKRSHSQQYPQFL